MQNHLPTILNMVNQPIIVLDEKHQLLYHNRKATKIFNTENGDEMILELKKIFTK
jgi:PAS domain-containing protein